MEKASPKHELSTDYIRYCRRTAVAILETIRPKSEVDRGMPKCPVEWRPS